MPPAPGSSCIGNCLLLQAHLVLEKTGIRQAIRDALSGQFGTLINVSMVLGHGGAPGMEKGWKLDPIRAGGGCLIDPGIHLLDLCNLLAPEGLEPVGGTEWRDRKSTRLN